MTNWNGHILEGIMDAHREQLQAARAKELRRCVDIVESYMADHDLPLGKLVEELEATILVRRDRKE